MGKDEKIGTAKICSEQIFPCIMKLKSEKTNPLKIQEPMDSSTKKKLNEQAREYLLAHPDCTHAELVKSIHHPGLSKGYFFNMRGLLRKQGKITRFGKTESQSVSPGKVDSEFKESKTSSTKMEILQSIEAGQYSQEVRDHYKSHVLPLLQRIIPNGKNLSLVFLSDPPSFEIRRLIS